MTTQATAIEITKEVVFVGTVVKATSFKAKGGNGWTYSFQTTDRSILAAMDEAMDCVCKITIGISSSKIVEKQTKGEDEAELEFGESETEVEFGESETEVEIGDLP